MWPTLVDLDREQCLAILRRLELEAYSSCVSALRAQGELNKERRKVLGDLASLLNISPERHKTEIRRAVNDEILATVATCFAGVGTENEWAREGRRIIPLVRRAVPITAFSGVADVAKREVEAFNQTLPAPAKTKTPVLPAKGRRGGDKVPPALSDIIVNGEVRPPVVSMPARSKQHARFANAMSDVVILPSGMAVRFKEEPSSPGSDSSETDDERKRKRRKRKSSVEEPEAKGTIEVFPSPFGHSHYSLPGSMPPPNFAPHTPAMGGDTKTRGVARRRGGGAQTPKRTPQQQKADSASSQSGHGYARPFMSQAHDFDARIPNSTYGLPQSTAQGTPQKQVVVVSPSGNIQSAPAMAKPPISELGPGGSSAEATLVAVPASQVPRHAPSPGLTAFPAMADYSAKGRTNRGGVRTQVVIPASALTDQVVKRPSSTPQSGAPNSAPQEAPSPSPLNALLDGTLAKAISAGSARIMTKPIAGAMTSATFAPGTPIYMVSTSTAPNAGGLMRVAARTVSTTASPVPPGMTNRIVTVSSASLRTPLGTTVTSTGSTTPGGGHVVRALQPRQLTGALMRPATPGSGRPSVIVVQRSPVSSVGAVAKTTSVVTAKDLQTIPGAPGGPRIIQTKMGQPVMIVSKSPGSGLPLPHPAPGQVSANSQAAVVLTPASLAAQTKGTLQAKTGASAQSGNVIVLDLSNDTATLNRNAVLSDILHATGILPSEDAAMASAEVEDADRHNSVEGQQQRTATKAADISNHRESLVQENPRLGQPSESEAKTSSRANVGQKPSEAHEDARSKPDRSDETVDAIAEFIATTSRDPAASADSNGSLEQQQPRRNSVSEA